MFPLPRPTPQFFLAKTHNVYFGILLSCYFDTMCWTGFQKKMFYLPTYPYLIDLGRRRGNNNFFKLGLTILLHTSVVNMTTREDCCSQTICQKSAHVEGRGPWAAMYRFTIPDTGISIYTHNHTIYRSCTGETFLLQCIGSQYQTPGSPSIQHNHNL